MILKRGRIKIAHFAHKPPTDCSWAKGETQAHLDAKLNLRDAFLKRGLKADVEFEIESLNGDRRADVIVWSPVGDPVAIELQHSTLVFEEFEKRTRSYIAADIPVIWVPFLRPKIWEDAKLLDNAVDGDYWIERYSAKPWERWVNGYNFGSIWYFDPRNCMMWRGKLEAHEIYVEQSEWYDQNGTEQSAGGYPRYSRRWRELTLWGPYTLGKLRIKKFHRVKKTIGNHVYPESQGAKFIVE